MRAPALTMMLPSAFKVSVAAPPLVLTIVLASVMLPAWAPVLPVVRVTLVPAFRLLSIVVLSTVALSAVGVKTLGLPLLKLPPVVVLVIVTLRGSSSQLPACPALAEASTLPMACRLLWLEVSTWPPLPLVAPPLASICP
jgi:hypothetical protein